MLTQQSYKGRKAQVRINGSMSRKFSMEQGLRQGGVLSMFHYTVFIDALVKKLEDLNCGVVIGNLKVSSPTVADDMALLSLWKPNLDKMLQVCYDYSVQWGSEYGPNKSAIMVYGETKHERSVQREKRVFMLGSNIITEVDTYPHLGVQLHIDENNEKRTTDRIGKARRELNAMSCLGIRPGCLAPSVASGIYWKVCMPTMIYGAEVWYKKKSDIEQFELSHRAAAKRIQWLPQNTHNDAVLALIGWLNVEAAVDKRQLVFIGSMVRLPRNSFPRQVFEYRYLSSPNTGLVKQYMELLKMYSLKTDFDDWLYDKSDMTYNVWKKLVANRVKDYHYST